MRVSVYAPSPLITTGVHKIALLHEIMLPPKFMTLDDCQFFSMAI
jgi:hypothetical protein